MKWLRIYIDRTLFGTTFDELNAEERGIWFSILVLAGYSPVLGKLCITDKLPYSKAQIEALLKLPEEVINRCLTKLMNVGKITMDENNIIAIANWGKYQTEYERQSYSRKVRALAKQERKEKYEYEETKSLDCGVEVLSGETVSAAFEAPIQLSKTAISKVEDVTGTKWGRVYKKRKKPEMEEILASFPDTVEEPEPKEVEPEIPPEKEVVERELIKETDEPFNADKIIKAEENADTKTGNESEQAMPSEYKTHLFIKTYCDSYKGRYKTFPEITKKTQGIASRLVEELGLTKCQSYIKSYLSMEDAWFKTKGHDLSTFEGNLNKVKVQFEQSKNKVTTIKIKTQEEIDRENKIRLDNRERMAQIMREHPIGKVIP